MRVRQARSREMNYHQKRVVKVVKVAVAAAVAVVIAAAQRKLD